MRSLALAHLTIVEWGATPSQSGSSELPGMTILGMGFLLRNLMAKGTIDLADKNEAIQPLTHLSLNSSDGEHHHRQHMTVVHQECRVHDVLGLGQNFGS